MSKPGPRSADLYIPVTPKLDNIVMSPPEPAPAEVPPSTPRKTRIVYTITSSVTRDRRKNRPAGQPRPFTRPTTTAPAPLPTPPRSVASTPPATSVSTPDPKIYPEANIIHYYTHCMHTSPPKTRPLNVQPTLIHSSPSAPKSTLLGRCYDCDSTHRREQEIGVLQKYQKASNALHLRLLAAKETLRTAEANKQVDEEGINSVVTEIDELIAKREADVKNVWKGFSARWGPGTVGVRQGLQGGGRMDIMWERPEKPVR